jgi:hypothetical protein
MSSKREADKTRVSSEEERTKVELATATTTSDNVAQAQQEQQQYVNRALDEAKDNIRKSIDEARSQLPRYTQAANQYQEQTIQTTREIADNYLESQKEIINSFQSSWVPAIERTYGVFWNYWTSPRRVADVYARTVSSIADNTIAATRLVNNSVFSNLHAFKTCIQNTRDNLKEVSRIGVNAAKTFEQTSRDTTTARSVSF